MFSDLVVLNKHDLQIQKDQKLRFLDALAFLAYTQCTRSLGSMTFLFHSFVLNDSNTNSEKVQMVEICAKYFFIVA